MKTTKETHEKKNTLEHKLNEKILKLEHSTTRKFQDYNKNLNTKINRDDLGVILFELVERIMSGKMTSKPIMLTNILEILCEHVGSDKNKIIANVNKIINKKVTKTSDEKAINELENKK